MTDEEKKIMIPLLEKLMNERCSNREKGWDDCTDKDTGESCPFYIEPYEWCDGWDCAISRAIRFLRKKRKNTGSRRTRRQDSVGAGL